jgi:uncharacterized protein (TIGR03083 family)
MPATADEVLEILQASVERLRATTEGLSPEQLRAPAYPSEWSIADVLSHLASGAVIMLARVNAVLENREVADDFAPTVWDEWDAKSPDAKAADALVADRALMDRMTSLTADERARFHVSFGPVQVDFAGALAMRLNEHALHSWDIAVALDPGATVAPDAVVIVVDNIGLIARFVGKPSGVVHDVRVHTTAPEREFVLAIGAEGVTLEPESPSADTAPADLELPAEAFVRLVYGRLDPAHTPSVRGTADLEELRRVFPGI